MVLIEWLDSHQKAGWHTEEPEREGLRCGSVGWLVYEGSEAVTVAAHMTWEEEPQRSGEMTIPRCAVVSIRDLT